MTDKTFDVMNESGIFENKDFELERNYSYHDFNLLKTTASSMLWRVSRDGKYFLVKTTKDNSEQQLKMLRREYELSIGCDNPHIVHVFTYEKDIHEGDGIVMEYIEGRTLDEFLSEKPSLKTCQRIFNELLSAVNYLHKRGIIHNDLKPENILITRADDTLKLIDFGLADNDAFYVWKTLGCTKEYASPELISQSKDIDARSDIYSIGIIMREIFGGRYTRIQKKCTSEKREKRYSELAELQRAWNGRNKIWKFMVALSVLVAIVIPTLLYMSMLKGEEQKVNQRDILIQEVKSEISRIFDESRGDVLKMAEEYTEYQNKIISETEDVELRNVLQNEMVLHYTKEFERVFGK